METYKKLQEDMRENKLQKYLKENYPESSDYFGILVPIPSNIDLRSTQEIYSEYQNPTNLKGEAADWKLWTALPCYEGSRTRSTVEMLFCMLRSKHSYTNLKQRINILYVPNRLYN